MLKLLMEVRLWIKHANETLRWRVSSLWKFDESLNRWEATDCAWFGSVWCQNFLFINYFLCGLHFFSSLIFQSARHPWRNKSEILIFRSKFRPARIIYDECDNTTVVNLHFIIFLSWTSFFVDIRLDLHLTSSLISSLLFSNKESW